MKDDRLYLLHVSECIAYIQEFTAHGKEAFLADRKTQDAVLRNLHTLSESVQRVSEDLANISHSGVARRCRLPECNRP
jgi:uncharacterized protein with HEPN domain